ncbi:hypothetical protein AWH48_12090 [Domibacillus aminovorans]|uniref:Terminase n=1 Tax=Domibacillus aminovorans TaxID=29332 RepID=A0A177KI66_9BACI|nr:terminase small subunit [Domibacillus aminovorans]OAH53090.1 hypothetical protein AWH48_12090 [Domibacillus aminovorans]
MVDWNAIRKEYEAGGITLKELAEKYGVKDATVRSRKNREKWDETQRNGNATQRKNVATPKERDTQSKKRRTKKNEPSAESGEITDQRRLFCMHYVKSFNATMAAIKAGYAKKSAHVEGSRLLRNAKVAAYIRELKADLQEDLFISAKDVMDYYVKIAFADITDYVTFQRKDVHTGRMEAVMSKDGKRVVEMVPKIESYNEMFFKNSDEIDGTIVSEVKQGKDGVSVKLIDKKWALDKLDRYFDLFPDSFKRRIEEEKLKIAQLAAKEDDADDYEDDGFNEALDGKTNEVWGDGHDSSEVD